MHIILFFIFCFSFFIFNVSLFLWIFLYVCTIYALGQLRQHTEIIQPGESGEAATTGHDATTTAATTTIDAFARNGSFRPAISVSCRSISSTDVAYSQPVPARSQYCTKSIGSISNSTDYIYSFCYDSVARYVLFFVLIDCRTRVIII